MIFVKNQIYLILKDQNLMFFIKEIPKSPTGKILRRKILAGEYELDN